MVRYALSSLKEVHFISKLCLPRQTVPVRSLLLSAQDSKKNNAEMFYKRNALEHYCT